ncbi:hypothetical protein B5K11_27060 [Rhizobium leguminosarum bv. trifolii]|uniref:alpha/beta hydrolase n=1 Tax=Rhizobium leguminosarum TaxID=384 RepID=UPI000E2FA9AA|nr:alpha/beta hydrolase [Rhizobium leguminosarum]RFB87073.1 hypothetical protein B5K11_27060 [Rhizobium leguminosarum bv. trifolii]
MSMDLAEVIPAPSDEISDIVRYVHPELREAAFAAAEAMRTSSPLSLETLPELRAFWATWGEQPAPDIPWEKVIIPESKGHPPVTIYLVNPRGGQGRPAILHTHGGGFVFGSAASDVANLQNLARELGCVIVSVEYRLAPETTYRGSIEDNYTALKWLYSNAAEFGVDRSRIGVMGESAGGGHAAMLAIAARDRGEIPISFQCLIYPMLDDRTGRGTVPHSVGKLEWTAANNQFGWSAFLGMEPGGADVPPSAVPARVVNLESLPPAFIAVGSIDLFVAEAIDYAKRLIEAGVSTELLVSPGAFHAFNLFPEAAGSSVLKQFNAARLTALRRGLQIT